MNQPIHFSPYAQMPQQHAPELGADTHAVLAEYGFTSDEIAKMRDRGRDLARNSTCTEG